MEEQLSWLVGFVSECLLKASRWLMCYKILGHGSAIEDGVWVFMDRERQ